MIHIYLCYSCCADNCCSFLALNKDNAAICWLFMSVLPTVQSACPSKRSTYMPLKKGNLLCSSKPGFYICPLKRAVYMSLKRATYMSLKKGSLYVPQKGNLYVPPKRQSIYPSKGQPKYRPKRPIYMSLKKGNLYVPQKGQTICPPKGQSICLWKGAIYIVKGGYLCVSQKGVSSVCPSKGQSILYVHQKGQSICPSKRECICPSKRAV